MTCLTLLLKQTQSIKLSKIWRLFKQKRLLFSNETTNLFIIPPASNCRFPAVCLYYQQHFRRQLGLYLSNHPRSCCSIHPSHVYHAVKLSLFLPIGVVNVPLLTQTLTHSPCRAWQSEISVWKLEGAVCVCLTGGLLGAGVIQVCELQLAGHCDKLPGLEVQQSHGAQRRLGQEVEEPDQVQTHLGGDQTCQNRISWIDDYLFKCTET